MKSLAPYLPFIAIVPGFFFYGAYVVAALVAGGFGANRDLTKTLKAKVEELRAELLEKEHTIAGLQHELYLRDQKKLEHGVSAHCLSGTYSDNLTAPDFGGTDPIGFGSVGYTSPQLG